MSMFSLTIVTPNGKILDGPVESLVAPGQVGSFGVYAQHAPMIAALGRGILKVTGEGKDSFYAIGKGVLEVTPQHTVLILSEQCLPANAEAVSETLAKIVE